MKRFLTCFKALAAPLVLCASMVILFLTIALVSWLVDTWSLNSRIKYLTVHIIPIMKDIVWPLVFFFVATLFRDEIVAFLVAIKEKIANLKSVSLPAGPFFNFNKDENCYNSQKVETVGENKVAKSEMPDADVDTDTVMRRACFIDARKYFDTRLQFGANMAVGGLRMNFTGAAMEKNDVTLLQVLRVGSENQVVSYLSKASEFIGRASQSKKSFRLLLYIVWKSRIQSIDFSEDKFKLMGAELVVKNLTETDCLRLNKED